MLVKPLAELFVHKLLDVAFDVAVQLALGLSLKLRLRQAHAHYGDQAFAHVIAGDSNFVLLLFQHSRRRSKTVDGARQRRPKSGKMRAAVHGIDRVRKSKHVFAVTIVVLQRNFDLHIAALSFNVNRRIVQCGLAAIQMLHEFRDTAREAELRAFLRALVGQRNLQPFVQERVLPQARRERVVAVDRLVKDAGIGMKSHFRSGLARFAGLFQLRGGLAFFVALLPHRAVARNLQLQPIGKRVHHGNTDAVQAA